MLALLKLIPLKDWAYLAILLTVLGVFGWYTAHERHIGAAKIVAVQTALNAAVEKNAEIKEIPIGHTYEKIITSAPVASTGLVCRSAATIKSQTADYRPEAPYSSAQVPTGSFDPSGPILTLLRDSDAQIDGLIDTVGVLQNELRGTP